MSSLGFDSQLVVMSNVMKDANDAYHQAQRAIADLKAAVHFVLMNEPNERAERINERASR
jgi:hypothetical protein